MHASEQHRLVNAYTRIMERAGQGRTGQGRTAGQMNEEEGGPGGCQGRQGYIISLIKEEASLAVKPRCPEGRPRASIASELTPIRGPGAVRYLGGWGGGR